MTYTENVRLAFQSIKGNRLRASLTALIIAVGLSALVGILSTIEAIKKSITDAFSNMGVNSFSIRNKDMVIRFGDGGSEPKSYKSIRYEDAVAFKGQLNALASVSISVFAAQDAIIKYKTKKTNPNTIIKGIDENGLASQGLNLAYGRNFNANEALTGANFCIIGADIAKTLFKKDKPLEKVINASNNKLLVIGVLESKGSAMGFNGDRTIYVPLYKAKLINNSKNPSYNITVTTPNAILMDNIIGEAISAFRMIRKIKIGETDDFEITRSDSLAQILNENLKYVVIGGFTIGIITLLGASVALMNIMLVSVTERTREIGVRKAIGANPAIIRRQFLTEAIVICLLGGSLGILLGIGLGNIVSLFMGGKFIMPWDIILGGFVLCLFVGLISGYYPAKKASQLNPTEALRYE